MLNLTEICGCSMARNGRALVKLSVRKDRKVCKDPLALKARRAYKVCRALPDPRGIKVTLAQSGRKAHKAHKVRRA